MADYPDIQFSCPACDAVMKVKPDASSLAGPCPQCGEWIQAPSLPASTAGNDRSRLSLGWLFLLLALIAGLVAFLVNRLPQSPEESPAPTTPSVEQSITSTTASVPLNSTEETSPTTVEASPAPTPQLRKTGLKHDPRDLEHPDEVPGELPTVE